MYNNTGFSVQVECPECSHILKFIPASDNFVEAWSDESDDMVLYLDFTCPSCGSDQTVFIK